MGKLECGSILGDPHSPRGLNDLNPALNTIKGSTCTFRASCYSTYLSWALVLTGVRPFVQDKGALPPSIIVIVLDEEKIITIFCYAQEFLLMEP